MNYRLSRSRQDVTINTEAGELGFILRPDRQHKGWEAWANLIPGVEEGQAHVFARAAVSTFDRLRDAITFITQEGVAL